MVNRKQTGSHACCGIDAGPGRACRRGRRNSGRGKFRRILVLAAAGCPAGAPSPTPSIRRTGTKGPGLKAPGRRRRGGYLRVVRDARGAATAEYALLLALVAIILITALSALGSALQEKLLEIIQSIQQAG